MYHTCFELKLALKKRNKRNAQLQWMLPALKIRGHLTSLVGTRSHRVQLDTATEMCL